MDYEALNEIKGETATSREIAKELRKSAANNRVERMLLTVIIDRFDDVMAICDEIKQEFGDG